MFNNTLKCVHKEAQLLIAQNSGLNPHRQLLRDRSIPTTKPKLRQHQSAGLSAQARS